MPIILDVKYHVPFKHEEIAAFVTRYSLEPGEKIKGILHDLYLSISHQVKDELFRQQAAINSEAFKTDLAECKKLQGFYYQNTSFHAVKFDISSKSKSLSVTLKSEFFKKHLLKKLTELVAEAGEVPTTPKKRGRKKTHNVLLIRKFIPMAKHLQSLGFNNVNIYRFILEFLTICEFDWALTARGVGKFSSLELARIDVLKTYLGPHLKKGNNYP